MSEDKQVSEAFNVLVDLFSSRREPVTGEQAYRNGWLDAYCFLTGEDGEEVYERVQEAVIARHEKQAAEAE